MKVLDITKKEKLSYYITRIGEEQEYTTKSSGIKIEKVDESLQIELDIRTVESYFRRRPSGEYIGRYLENLLSELEVKGKIQITRASHGVITRAPKELEIHVLLKDMLYYSKKGHKTKAIKLNGIELYGIKVNYEIKGNSSKATYTLTPVKLKTKTEEKKLSLKNKIIGLNVDCYGELPIPELLKSCMKGDELYIPDGIKGLSWSSIKYSKHLTLEGEKCMKEVQKINKIYVSKDQIKKDKVEGLRECIKLYTSGLGTLDRQRVIVLNSVLKLTKTTYSKLLSTTKRKIFIEVDELEVPGVDLDKLEDRIEYVKKLSTSTATRVKQVYIREYKGKELPDRIFMYLKYKDNKELYDTMKGGLMYYYAEEAKNRLERSKTRSEAEKLYISNLKKRNINLLNLLESEVKVLKIYDRSRDKKYDIYMEVENI